ncbi:Ubl-specific protease [Fusarium tjaetaba]|uniref:Ubl-specific protease n=1 Tax=Fusarium tjaetaba TaxID=1567544 RepID=A0A8H5RBU3_9HYPO|nr:Ubl-specific protease [Fusarium tjaetaba]KAF5630372.1 Ubl-specific protease [Fusarium tjaetaba]
MSFSLQSRISVHQSANQRGSYVPSHIVEAAQRRRERQQLQIISKAKATTQVQVSLPWPKVEFVTPPRQIRRPTARLLIDSPLPRREIFQDPVLHQRFIDTESPPNLDRYSNQKPRPKPQAETVNTNDGAPSTPTPKTSTTSTSISDPNFVVVDGIQTRKRRAEDTEIDLVAAQIGVTDTSSPIITLRQGETVPSEESGQQAHTSSRMLGITTGARSITRMISSLYSAFTGIGETITRILRPQSYQIAECRSYLSENQVSNKRVKISTSCEDNAVSNTGAPGQSAGLRWIDQDGLTTLLADYKYFSKSFMTVWECLEQGARQEANKDLAPLSTDIVDAANRSDALNHDFYDIFTLQLQRIYDYLDRIYEVGVIVKIRDNNEFVPPILDYGLSTEFAAHLESMKHFLSGPALPVVCNNILKKYGEDYWNVSQAFLDRVVLDIKAILRNLPAPSYVDSEEYRGKLQDMFPTPPRTDLETRFLLPGSFPESDELKKQIDTKPDEQTASTTEAVAAKLAVQAILPEPVPSYPRPDVPRPHYYKTDFLRAGFAHEKIKRITPADYRQTFYEESNEHQTLKTKYITEFTPKVPLTSNETGTLRSILRNRRKHPSKVTPKRLRVTGRPKAVRFTDDTISPKPRTRLGLDVPKQINYDQETGEAIPPTQAFQEQRPHWTRGWLNIPPAPAEEPPKKTTFNPLSIGECLRRRRLEEHDGRDFHTRIKEIFELPSIDLQISDDSRARIDHQVQEATLKAAEEARLAAEAVQLEAEEKARKEREERLARSGGLREPNQTFVAPVSPEWHTRAMNTLNAASSTSLAKSAEGVDLRKHDFAKIVSSTEWLNDEIVNASLVWLDRAINSAAGIKDVKRNTRKIWTPGSFFFKRLQDQGTGNTQRTLRRYGIEKRNFLDIDTILLPICEHSHWTLLVIRPSKRTVAHMDSINAGGNRSYTARAMAWIRDILEEKFVEDEWKTILHEAPLQNNGHDCGVHTITNAMCLSLGISPIEAYTADDMPTQRIRIACMLLNGGFTNDFDLRAY